MAPREELALVQRHSPGKLLRVVQADIREPSATTERLAMPLGSPARTAPQELLAWLARVHGTTILF